MSIKELDEQNIVEHVFESTLWSGRWAIILAVVGGMLTAGVMFYIAFTDVYHLAELSFQYAGLENNQARALLRAEVIGHGVQVIDGFLLAIVLLIFSYGIYELYISRIAQAYGTNTAKHLLRINNLDDLKTRLGKVILMILVVKFFEIAISMPFHNVNDLMLFAIAIILIGITLFMNQLVEYFTHNRRSSDAGREGPEKRQKTEFDRRSKN